MRVLRIKYIVYRQKDKVPQEITSLNCHSICVIVSKITFWHVLKDVACPGANCQ